MTSFHLYSQTGPFRRHAEAVTLHRVTNDSELDDYGNPLETVTDATMRALVEPVSGSETIEGEDRQTSRCRLYIDPCDTITGHDRFTIRGVLWHVDGPPDVWPNGQVVTVRREA